MKDQPAYIMDLEDIVRMRDLEIRKLKERVAELEGKIAAAADEMLKPAQCQTGDSEKAAPEAYKAVRELLMVVEHLRFRCEHAEGRRKVDRLRLLAGMCLGIRAGVRWMHLVPDYQSKTFHADMDQLIEELMGDISRACKLPTEH
jgi:hypothetical protein